MKRSCRGQALIEVIAFFGAFAVLMAGFCEFTKWITVRQKLLLAAKQGALLYSSGHFRRSDVEASMKRFLTSGSPALLPDRVSVSVGRGRGVSAFLYEFDEISAAYRRPGGWYPLLGLDAEVKETLIVKHAPHYWAPFQPLGGPGVPW